MRRFVFRGTAVLFILMFFTGCPCVIPCCALKGGAVGCAATKTTTVIAGTKAATIGASVTAVGVKAKVAILIKEIWQQAEFMAYADTLETILFKDGLSLVADGKTVAVILLNEQQQADLANGKVVELVLHDGTRRVLPVANAEAK